MDFSSKTFVSYGFLIKNLVKIWISHEKSYFLMDFSSKILVNYGFLIKKRSFLMDFT